MIIDKNVKFTKCNLTLWSNIYIWIILALNNPKGVDMPLNKTKFIKLVGQYKEKFILENRRS